MRISFDIDDTLICGITIPTEQCVPWGRRWRYPERLRRGTQLLMTSLLKRRCRIWIYTSSCRSPSHIKTWFRSFGVPLEGVINQALHEETVGLRGPSKYPPAFGIDLHVDDSVGVAIEGAIHRFPVLIISPEEKNWVEQILSEVDKRIHMNSHWNTGHLVHPQSFEIKRIHQCDLAHIGGSLENRFL